MKSSTWFVHDLTGTTLSCKILN